jgi:hypothetical protein
MLCVMGFLDKAKTAAEQAAAKAKEEYEELQLKRELGQAYDALGKAAFELVESGALAHEKLEEPAAKVRTLRQRQDAGAEPETPEPDAEPEPVEAADDEPADTPETPA